MLYLKQVCISCIPSTVQWPIPIPGQAQERSSSIVTCDYSKWSVENFGPSHQALLPKPPPDPVDDKYDECQRHRNRPESPKIRRHRCLLIRRIEVEKLTPTDTLFTFSVATYVL